MHLSVIIPAYNEQNRIGKTLVEVDKYLSKQDYTYEILVVNDGSRDKTAKAVTDMVKDIKNLRLIDNKRNHGKGWVVKKGMLEAKGDYRLFTDADNSTPIDQIENFWPHIKNGKYDIVIGSIELKGAKVNEHAQWYRRLLGHMSKLLIRVVAELGDIKDTQRGFKLFKGEVAEKIFSKAKIDRFGFDFEVLAIAKRKKFKIKELPVIWNNDGESKVNLGSYIATFKDLIIVRLNLWSGKYK